MSSGNECICMLECTINNVIRLRDREEQKERARCTACTVQQWASATAVPAPTTSTTRGHGTRVWPCSRARGSGADYLVAVREPLGLMLAAGNGSS